ncbi:MAG: aminotransferase class III-fold pyridoxal phosphate-dependent enzyme [Alphaproteobacteria bacterium]|nr:aminotransferase class III-fold pyridoxal phosphate-dependent enzyme [Alphaproteobacteria bacterium]MCB9929796.1 aminotransferase class III-fold pyridoxal phosphate-dependent enzyme [Alphaproteobacteria bacterium]
MSVTTADRRNFDLSAALDEAEKRFAAANPASETAFRSAGRSMPGGNTRTVLFYPPYPLTLAGGDGCFVTDIDGHRYTDFVTEQTAGLYGHSDPRIQAAVRGALEHGITLGGPTAKEAELADLLTARFPALDLVRFTNSGTEANLLALQTARAITGRNAVMVFDGSYHGSVLSFGPYGREMNVPMTWVMATYNNVDDTAATIRACARDLAAVIVEPMTGSGGCIPATPEFLAMLREVTAEQGVLLIFDEVMTSRLGPAGYQGVCGITPDMMSMGKYLGGGLTFGAFGGREDIMAHFDPARPNHLSHAGTFNNNVLTLAAATVGLSEVFTADAARAMNDAGNRLRTRLNERLAHHGLKGQVTGYGSMMMLHLTDQPLSSPADSGKVPAAARGLFHLGMIERGYYVARRNMMVLSLPMGETEFDGLVDAVDDWCRANKTLFA